MAYRRSISTRVILFSQRLHPSFGYVLHNDDRKNQPPAADASRDSRPTTKYFLQPNSNLNSLFAGSGALFRGGGSPSFSFHPGLGSSLCSYSTGAIGGGSDKLEYMGDVAEILTEKSLEAGQAAIAQAPVVSEVAIAAADSFPNVAALQYLIDGIHSFTGFNWWASIALTTLMIRLAILPLSVNQMRASSKLALMKPELEAVKEQMSDMAMDPKAFAEGQKQMKALFKKHGVTPFTPLKGLLIQGPIFISFFMAITNMVEKVPSLKEGGALWFTDLTTPDALYIFPVLTSLTFLVTVEAIFRGLRIWGLHVDLSIITLFYWFTPHRKLLRSKFHNASMILEKISTSDCNMQEGMEGNPAAGHMKNFSRLIAVLTIPFTMSFPKAIFCYWVTSNFFSLIYGLVIKRPQVKKFLKLPELPPPSTTTTTTTTTPQSLFSLFSTSKATEKPSQLLMEPSKVADRRISSSSVMSQRIRSLEKQVKGKKKNKKR